jgi:hypothetical protein
VAVAKVGMYRIPTFTINGLRFPLAVAVYFTPTLSKTVNY